MFFRIVLIFQGAKVHNFCFRRSFTDAISALISECYGWQQVNSAAVLKSLRNVDVNPVENLIFVKCPFVIHTTGKFPENSPAKVGLRHVLNKFGFPAVKFVAHITVAQLG